MLGNNAIIRFPDIEILDQMMPDAPFPDDLQRIWVDLDDTFKPKLAVIRDVFGITTLRDRGVGQHLLPDKR